MSTGDLTSVKPGDIVEYQLPISKRIERGTFQQWHGVEPQRLVVWSHQARTSISVAQTSVTRIIPQGGESYDPSARARRGWPHPLFDLSLVVGSERCYPGQ